MVRHYAAQVVQFSSALDNMITPPLIIVSIYPILEIVDRLLDRPGRMAGNSLFTAMAVNAPILYLNGWMGNPFAEPLAEFLYFGYSSQRCGWMTLYGYARVSVREPEDKSLDLQVGRMVRVGCAMGNIRADTLVVTHIDRLSRGLTYGLQVIEGLHHAGVEFRSLSEDFDTATANGKLQLQMALAFSEWWRNSTRERSVAWQAKVRTVGCFPVRRPSLTEQQRECIRGSGQGA